MEIGLGVQADFALEKICVDPRLILKLSTFPRLNNFISNVHVRKFSWFHCLFLIVFITLITNLSDSIFHIV